MWQNAQLQFEFGNLENDTPLDEFITTSKKICKNYSENFKNTF